MIIEYPKWLYNRHLAAALVNTPEQHAALGKGWESTPAAFEEEDPEPEPEARKRKSK